MGRRHRCARSRLFHWVLGCVTLFLVGGQVGAVSPSPFQVTPALPQMNGVQSQQDWILVGSSGQPSWLRVPSVCRMAWCGLVVISHPRGQSPERLRDSSSMAVMLDALLNGGYAVLLASDAGLNTWGSPHALEITAEAHRQAVSRFHWNGKTYAMGYSMGGLTALRSTLPGSPYRVDGLILIDAWVNLQAAWARSLSRRQEITAAYPLNSRALADLDPLPRALKAARLPMLILASDEDDIAPAVMNGVRIYARALPGPSAYVKLRGPHLGGNRFTPDVARSVMAFLTRVTKKG